MTKPPLIYKRGQRKPDGYKNSTTNYQRKHQQSNYF